MTYSDLRIICVGSLGIVGSVMMDNLVEFVLLVLVMVLDEPG